MRIAISADDGRGLDGVISPHLGRCPYYVLVDVEGTEVKAASAVENPHFNQHLPGQVPGFIHRQNVQVMLAGGMGRRAMAFFEQYGIEAVTGASGTVRHGLQLYLAGGLRGAAPCRESLEHAHKAESAPGTYVPGSAEGMAALDENTQHAVARRAADLMQQGYH